MQRTRRCAHVPTPVCTTDRRIDQSIKLIKAYNRWKPLTLAYSGGKDSDCVRQLCKLAQVPVTLVHNCTTIDYPYTLKHCAEAGAIIQRPKTTFYQLVEKKGLPSMFRRFCCDKLKEMYIADTLLLGVRKDESVKRDKRYTEPTACRIFSKTKHCEQVLPLVMWTNNDLQNFVEQESLQLHPHYYVNGRLDITRRVGCIGCPLQGDRGRADYLEFPRFLRLLVKAYAKYVSTHKAVNGVYEDVVWQLFYSNHKEKQYQQTFHGIMQAPDPKEFLEDYFHVDLTF